MELSKEQISALEDLLRRRGPRFNPTEAARKYRVDTEIDRVSGNPRSTPMETLLALRHVLTVRETDDVRAIRRAEHAFMVSAIGAAAWKEFLDRLKEKT